ncbi:heterocycloanthracin/sonorensin family bacteriocin [Sporosarcina thermotolerans]|uniref:Heterocycloanthracin/sonorensin family bacteriocin n=2 Tax=Sporosarcina thermotolerans TaxID=633404 RepID=A0AAW9A8W7_9BACL|nr:heterocycloanthracin/sonorensin family bacteriocin [Sporosarcina thermotolerans]MDW0117897.1 heterocycloanthracin/sonorensin family bacteriocin [Sporosarcina thermotolerans]WHT49872.1 heterocycloanthracin/sonorensin family bacteriocin [Sporosarcina thermotolerans]
MLNLGEFNTSQAVNWDQNNPLSNQTAQLGGIGGCFGGGFGIGGCFGGGFFRCGFSCFGCFSCFRCSNCFRCHNCFRCSSCGGRCHG